MNAATTDEEPWRVCYRELAPKLLLFARQWLHSSADAEDAVQTAFVRFWTKRPDARREDYPLLFATVRSAALDLLRSRDRRSHREHEYHLNGAVVEWFEAPCEQQEEAEALQKELQRLPEEQREVVVLRVWGDLTFAEIANVLGISINTAAARYRYGLQALRKNFKANEHERLPV